MCIRDRLSLTTRGSRSSASHRPPEPVASVTGVGADRQTGPVADRPDVPDAMLERLRAVAAGLPECQEEGAWVGTRWKVANATVAHIFGGCLLYTSRCV